MPQAVTHLLIPLIILALFRDYFVKNKKTFPLHYVFIGGLAGLIPDLDVAVYYGLSFFGFKMAEVHRTFSHSLIFVLFFIVLGFLMYGFKNKSLGKHHLKLRNLFFVLGFGIFMHILLDFLIIGKVMPFYPLNDLKMGLNWILLTPANWKDSIIASMDAMFLILGLLYLEFKHKISDFI